VYSDNDFISGKIVEAYYWYAAGAICEKYSMINWTWRVQVSTKDRFPLNYIAPTEEELGWQQLIHGDTIPGRMSAA
jgi:hypothetical protein